MWSKFSFIDKTSSFQTWLQRKLHSVRKHWLQKVKDFCELSIKTWITWIITFGEVPASVIISNARFASSPLVLIFWKELVFLPAFWYYRLMNLGPFCCFFSHIFCKGFLLPTSLFKHSIWSVKWRSAIRQNGTLETRFCFKCCRVEWWTLANSDKEKSRIFRLRTQDWMACWCFVGSISKGALAHSVGNIVSDNPSCRIIVVGVYLFMSRNPNNKSGFPSPSQITASLTWSQLGFQHSWSGFKFSKYRLQSSLLLKRFPDILLRWAQIKSSWRSPFVLRGL